MAVTNFVAGMRNSGAALASRLLPEAVSPLGAVHLLADLLEALEQACADLLAASHQPDLTQPGNHADVILVRSADVRDFIDTLEAHELAIIAKLDRARLWAGLVGRSDERLRRFANLFHAGTSGLADLMPRLADPAETLFHGGGQQLPFLMSRGLISDARATADGSLPILIDEHYLLCGIAPLGDLANLCTSTLNALDAHYDLYEVEAAEAGLIEDALSYDAGVAAEGLPPDSTEPAVASELGGVSAAPGSAGAQSDPPTAADLIRQFGLRLPEPPAAADQPASPVDDLADDAVLDLPASSDAELPEVQQPLPSGILMAAAPIAQDAVAADAVDNAATVAATADAPAAADITRPVAPIDPASAAIAGEADAGPQDATIQAAAATHLDALQPELDADADILDLAAPLELVAREADLAPAPELTTTRSGTSDLPPAPEASSLAMLGDGAPIIVEPVANPALAAATDLTELSTSAASADAHAASVNDQHAAGDARGSPETGADDVADAKLDDVSQPVAEASDLLPAAIADAGTESDSSGADTATPVLLIDTDYPVAAATDTEPSTATNSAGQDAVGTDPGAAGADPALTVAPPVATPIATMAPEVASPSAPESLDATQPLAAERTLSARLAAVVNKGKNPAARKARSR